MSVRLLDRNKQIPYGLHFYQPETKWQPRRGIDSFDVIVRNLIAHRNANPYLRDKNKWATDVPTVEAELDHYNAQLCLAQGWTQYIQDGGSIPKGQAPSLSLLKRISAAAGQIKDLKKGYDAIQAWRDSGKPPVDFPLANKRAETCAACPLNEPGDWTKWFTIPYSEHLRKEFEKSFWTELKTDNDDKLKVCSACLCPLRALVFCPVEFIAPTLDDKKRSALAKGLNCWQLAESV